jgi:hypothetical protein
MPSAPESAIVVSDQADDERHGLMESLSADLLSFISGLRPPMRAEVFDSFCLLLMGLLVSVAKHSRAPRGEQTFIVGALSFGRGLIAVMTLTGAVDTSAFDSYLLRVLALQLHKGDVIALDNLNVSRIEEVAEARGARGVGAGAGEHHQARHEVRHQRLVQALQLQGRIRMNTAVILFCRLMTMLVIN